MPVVTAEPPPPLTPEQQALIREIIREEIAAWYGTPIPNAKDRDGNPFSRYQADLRGVYGYDTIRQGGVLEKRVTATEAAATAAGAAIVVHAQRLAAVETQAAMEAAEQDSIEESLAKPIRPQP
jgi:hypothetical protein